MLVAYQKAHFRPEGRFKLSGLEEQNSGMRELGTWNEAENLLKIVKIVFYGTSIL